MIYLENCKLSCVSFSRLNDNLAKYYLKDNFCPPRACYKNRLVKLYFDKVSFLSRIKGKKILQYNDSFLAPRDNKQIRNLKYREIKKDKQQKVQQHNIADEILEVIAMLDSHPFVQEIVHSKDKMSSIICYTT